MANKHAHRTHKLLSLSLTASILLNLVSPAGALRYAWAETPEEEPTQEQELVLADTEEELPVVLDDEVADVIDDETVLDRVEETEEATTDVVELEEEVAYASDDVVEVEDEGLELEPMSTDSGAELSIPGPEQRFTPGLQGNEDSLLEGYINQQFERALQEAGSDVVLSTQSISLTGNDAVAYNLLKDFVTKVADGSITSTKLSIPLDAMCSQTMWTAADLGVSDIVVKSGSSYVFTDEALAAADKKVSFNLSKTLSKLLVDCPYELYWYDKTASTTSSGVTFKASYKNKEWHLSATGSIVVSMPVASGYQSSTYVIKGSTTTEMKRVKTAVNKAKTIVNANVGGNAAAQLENFRSQICSLVSYNTTAAKNNVPFGDPWQLVYVFDGETGTNVVCEGYSKAFKYLCDLAKIDGVECHLVTGTMRGGTGAGAHMWNVVRMPDGKNYLVDVTNCDAGTIGAPKQLFVVPYTSGSRTAGYTVRCNSGSLTYTYDSETTAMFSSSDLTLSSSDYNSANDIPSDPNSVAGATVSSIASQKYSGEAIEPHPTVKMGTTTLVEGTDYAISYANNVNAGTATVTITGKGTYTGKKTATFSITKRTVTLTSPSDTKTYDGTALTAPSVTMGGDGFVEGEINSLRATGSQTAAGTATNAIAYNVTGAFKESNYNVTTNPGTLKVNALSLSGATVSVGNQTYNGNALTPAPAVVLGGTTLKSGTDYTASYKNNVNAGSATLSVTGKGNYAGTLSKTFTIMPGTQTISANDATVAMGETVALNATSSLDGTLTYRSANTDVATVDASGVVTPQGMGETTILITAAATSNFSSATRSVTVTVTRGQATITATNKEVLKGKTVKLAATTDSNGQLTYTSANTAYGTVTDAGVAKGVKAGKTIQVTITVPDTPEFAGTTKTVTVKVCAKVNPMKAAKKASTVKASYNTLKSKALTLATNIKFTKKAQGKVTYTNASTNATAKKFKVAAGTGKVTVPKGTKKGTYAVKIKVKAAGNVTYLSATQTITYYIKVA